MRKKKEQDVDPDDNGDMNMMELKANVGDIHPTEQDETYLVELAVFLNKDQISELMTLKQNGKVDILVKGSD